MAGKVNDPLDWTGDELDLIISDYFLMLNDEATGVSFNKAQHNRLLRSKIDRSEGSIEFKHQNISAVLERLGLPRIRGYLPAANYQKAITAAIDRYLTQNPIALHPERAISGFTERSGLFVETPPMLLPVTPQREDIERLVRKFNPVERDFRNRNLGRDGEELVFQFERARLERLDRADLAKKIRWISEEDGDGAGYDILSFDTKGKERFLEVKTTVGSDTTPFILQGTNCRFLPSDPTRFACVAFLNSHRNHGCSNWCRRWRNSSIFHLLVMKRHSRSENFCLYPHLLFHRSFL